MSDMTIEDMQTEILRMGYVFIEKTFPNGDTFIKFKKSSDFNPYAGGELTDNGWTLGWGRFQRWDAWERAVTALRIAERR